MSNQPSNPKPRSNSLSNEVNRTHKSAVRALFHDDYQTNNTVEFEGNLKGSNSAIQYKSVVDVNCKDYECNLSLNDEARLDFKLPRDSVFRLKLKPTNVLGHLDFSHYGYRTRMQNQNLNFWFNPYVQYQANRSLSNGALFLGLMTNLNNGVFANNARVKLQSKGEELAGEFENNWTIKYNNWTFNWYYIDNLKNWSRNVSRKVTAEYLNDKLSVAAELAKNTRGAYWDWNMDTLNLGLAYQHNKDLTYGLWSSTDLLNGNATNVATGADYKVNKDVAIKAKADTNQDVSFFANYKCAQGLSLQMSLQSTFDADRLKNTCCGASKFGLKVKYDS